MRNKVWDWYQDVFSTREEGEGCIVIIATRWHKDDLIGRLLKKAEEDPEADQWEVINLPALSDEEQAPYDQRTNLNNSMALKFSMMALKKRAIYCISWLFFITKASAISVN
jgi:hypothetical protein